MGAGAAGAPGDRITVDLPWVNLSPSSSTGIPLSPPSLWRGLGYRHATPCLMFTR
jgi:hypothetical protein